jgi:hypothetical protein
MTATATITEIELPTAEQIADLFREHDVLPWQSIYLALPDELAICPGKCAACAIGILLVMHRGSASRARSYCRRSGRTVKQALEAETGLPPDFVEGLDDGFSVSNDGETCEEYLAEWDADNSEDPLYVEGFRVGWRAWELATAGESP